MTNNSSPKDERLADLLASKATEGLEAAEHLELRCLLGSVPNRDEDAMELAAAAVDLALGDHDFELPLGEGLGASLKSMARDFSQTAPGDASSSEPESEASASLWRTKLRGPISGLVAGILAASIVVFAGIDQGWFGGETAPARNQTVIERFESFRAVAEDQVRAQWAGEAGYERVEGEVMFSPRLQEGYMVFRGLPKNDPTQSQYQLWIVDPSRDKEPVDGGVFNLESETGESIVPIRAALKVSEPTLFVITLEQPGGVVVSEGPFRVIAKP